MIGFRPSLRRGGGGALLALALLLTLSGCGGTLRVSERLDRARRAESCARVPVAVRAARYRTEPPELELPPDMDPDVRRVAEAARLDSETLHRPARRLERIMLLQAEIDAAASEISCLDDQLEALEDELESRQSNYELTLTLASIAVGAVSTIVASAVDLTGSDSIASPLIQLGGGVVSGVLGGLALFPLNEAFELEHERNVLRAVWDPESGAEGTLSRFVVELLRAPRKNGISPKDELRAELTELASLLGEDGEALLLGDGGRYDLQAIQARELALELLETQISLQRQDLELLLRYFVFAEEQANETNDEQTNEAENAIEPVEPSSSD